jgi:hypothetical protein
MSIGRMTGESFLPTAVSQDTAIAMHVVSAYSFGLDIKSIVVTLRFSKKYVGRIWMIPLGCENYAENARYASVNDVIPIVFGV